MEIVKLINQTYQVVDSATNSVIFQGSHEDCVECLANYMRLEEEQLYSQFLQMAGF